MASISETIANFQRLSTGLMLGDDVTQGRRLSPMDASGRNPGNLLARMHVPANLPEGAPLVVVLHGCTQTANAYDRGSGWSTLADRFGFVVLYPEPVFEGSKSSRSGATPFNRGRHRTV